MSDGEVVRPFRWDVSQRSQLGSLPYVELPETYPKFEDDLLECSARVIAFGGDSDLLFVGRSPHVIFDLLSGLLLDTSWNDRLHLFNVSLRAPTPTSEQLAALLPYLTAVGLDPSRMVHRARPIALIDIVAGGGTMTDLVAFLSDLADRQRVSWSRVAQALRIVGLTWRTKTSPKTWRWQHEVEWVGGRRPGAIKNVSIPGRLFSFLAADVPKTSPAYHPDRWGIEDVASPSQRSESRRALALAVHLFDLGRSPDTRRRFARALADQRAMTESWFRSLALEIKR